MPHYRKLVGTKVYLSPVSEEDLELFTLWINDLETTLKLTLAPKIISREQEREFIKQMQEGCNFSIVLKENDRLLGSCGLMSVDQVQRTAELGIFIGDPAERGKGYGSEAIRLLLDYAFGLLNLHSIQLRVRSFNSRAYESYIRIGFREIGRRRECLRLGGTYYDEIYMDILDREFTGILAPLKNPGGSPPAP